MKESHRQHSAAAMATAEDGMLDSLLAISSTPDGRAKLAGSGIVPETLLRLSPSDPFLLPRLRLLRNLCAGDAHNQSSFLHSGGPDRLAAALLPPPPSPPAEVARAALQALGNVALAGADHRAAIWGRFFPEAFMDLARIRDRGVVDPLCMVLDTCCSSDGGRRRLRFLCDADFGLPILSEIVVTASHVGHREEWLQWLLLKACVEEQFISGLYDSLSSNANGEPFTREQCFLLGLLSKCLTECPNEVVTISGEFALTIRGLVEEASGVVDFSVRGGSSLPTGSPPIDILGYGICIAREICAWDGGNPSAHEDEVVEPLVSSGLLRSLLGFLCDLEPPSSIRKHMADNAENSSSASHRSQKLCPYKGFRSDVVAVIANLSHRRRRVQDEIRSKNGIPVMLQQCVIDEDNPFSREWGVLAVRNLLEGNEENQREVSELQMLKPASTDVIAELGFKVEVDRKGKRAKLVNL